MLSIPFSGPLGCPVSLALHPLLPSSLLVGCARGGVVLADAATGAVGSVFTVSALHSFFLHLFSSFLH